ncbi:MAG: hypothetical protein IBX56_12530 [Methylomicrobium sp.]|nr:hypothetical protein [Methylomicrobium sp.]
MERKKTMPPYSKGLNNKPADLDIIILLGPTAWEIAKSTWLCRSPKLVMPADHDPSEYHWPVLNRTVIIRECGGNESADKILNLIRAVLEAGAIYVLFVRNNLVTTMIEPDFETDNGE